MKNEIKKWYIIEWDFYLLDKPRKYNEYYINWFWNDGFWNQVLEIEKNWITILLQNDYSFNLNITNLVEDILFNEFIKNTNWLKMIKWLEKRKKNFVEWSEEELFPKRLKNILKELKMIEPIVKKSLRQLINKIPKKEYDEVVNRFSDKYEAYLSYTTSLHYI